MAGPSRTDPYTVFHFLVEIDGLPATAFSSVSGLESETAVIEYRTGAEATRVRKLPGLTKYANIVLKRGMTQDTSLWGWRQQIVNGKADRRSGSIILLDQSGNEVHRWNFVEGWPAKIEGPALNARANEIAIETLEIAHEGLELVA